LFERLYDELFGGPEGKTRPRVLSVLAIYYMLSPFLYLFAISTDGSFLQFGFRGAFGMDDWALALLYCAGAPLLGYLLWTLRVRTHVALYTFLGFELIRGFRNGIWIVVLMAAAILIYAVRGNVRALFSSRESTPEAHR